MKNKVLFVVSCFNHGGAEREMYELDKALDRSKIEPSILCSSNLDESKYFSDYFYKKHIKLNTKVYFLKEILKIKKSTLINKILNRLKLKNNILDYRKKIKYFLNDFDQVFFMGEYVYKDLSTYIQEDKLNEINIFIMSARFQGEKYRNFNKENKYNFISPFDTDLQVNYEFEGFNNYKHIFFPLSFIIDKTFKKWSYNNKKIKKIGIFTRLNKAKPLDPFFYTFHLLLKEMPEVELHIFGAGNYIDAGYDRYINHLNLNDKVFFRGHQEDIKRTLNEENLNLVWFQGYLNRPAGYAGQDVSVTGTPILLWDFFRGHNPNINNLNYVYPHFKDIELLKSASMKVLLDETIAKELSVKQFSEVVKSRDMNKNINKIDYLLIKKNDC